jgi:hypothetical protein
MNIKKFAIIIIVIIAAIMAYFFFINNKNISVDQSFNQDRSVLTNMKISSNAFEHMGLIPSIYTCDGANINPSLNFDSVPTETKGLVLIMDDPDAPMGTWDHWVVFNIPPDTKEIKEGSEPAGTQGITSFRKTGYGGPCPPDREHRYFFKLYALDTLLDLPEGSAKKKVEAAMQGHILAEAELIGRYTR